MARRLLASSLLLLSLAACGEEPPAPWGLEARLMGRLERDPADPGAWIGVESLSVVAPSGEVLCVDEVEVVAGELSPCADCSVMLSVSADAGALRCVLADGDELQRASGRYLGFVPRSRFGPAISGWIDSAEAEVGPWETFSEGLLDPEGLAWHHELVLEHTVAADLEGGPVSTSSDGPPSR